MEDHTCLLCCLKCSLIRSEDLIRVFVATNAGDRLCGVTVCTWAVTDSFSFMEILIFSDHFVQRSLANHSYTSYWYLLEVVHGCLHAAAQLGNWMSYQAGFHIKWWIPVMITAALMRNHLGKCILWTHRLFPLVILCSGIVVTSNVGWHYIVLYLMSRY